MSPHPAPSPASPPPARRTLRAAECQPSADAGCGHCLDCREAATRRFDAALHAGLERIRRAAPVPVRD